MADHDDGQFRGKAMGPDNRSAFIMTMHFPLREELPRQLEAGAVQSSSTSAVTADNRPEGNLSRVWATNSAGGGLWNTYRSGGKRILETVLTLLAAPFVVPVVLFFAGLIALDGHNPFYSQDRIGQGGRRFRMWKLRTMVHNADQLLEEYLAANPRAQAEWSRCQKLKDDPRVTFMGRFLRKVSIDELPQLLNVLNGTMSLVGPRPMMVSQRDCYTGTAYFDLKPGITGLWQISDRNECEFTGRVRYDEAYSRVVSPILDLRILISTVSVVFRGTGY
ncbi:MAG: sugar transferase [Pseudomonadota bacterium]